MFRISALDRRHCIRALNHAGSLNWPIFECPLYRAPAGTPEIQGVAELFFENTVIENGWAPSCVQYFTGENAKIFLDSFFPTPVTQTI